jgi:hypothetical protein
MIGLSIFEKNAAAEWWFDPVVYSIGDHEMPRFARGNLTGIEFITTLSSG